MLQPCSEGDTRRQLIDEGLRLAGWDVDNHSQVIQELNICLVSCPERAW